MHITNSLLILQLLVNIITIIISVQIAYTIITYFIKDKLPYTPTPNSITKKIVKKNIFTEKDKILDIGSGTGKILFRLATKTTASDLTGVEKRKELYLYSKLKKLCLGLIYPQIRQKNIKFINDDIVNHDLSKYNKIYMFSLPKFTEKYLTPKFNKELKKGTQIITTMFEIKKNKNLKLIKTIKAKDWILIKKRTIKVFIYEKI